MRITTIVTMLVLFIAFAAGPFFATAQSTCETGNPNEACVRVDNTGGTINENAAGTNEPQTAQGYLKALYNFLLGFIGVAAMGSIVYGGVLYIISAGNPSRVGQAKDAIWNGIIGLLVAGFGYLILVTINPDLVGGFDLKSVVKTNLQKAQQ